MNRHIHVACPGAPSYSPEGTGLVRDTFTIDLVTPLFGGGVEPGCNDPVTLIRPSSIRGQLRFWWRATRGARLGSVRNLRQREGEIWGTTEKPSRVSTVVTVLDRSRATPCLRYVWNAKKRRGKGGFDLVWLSPFGPDKSLPYALFPFQGKPPQDPTDAPPRQQDKPADRVDHARFLLTVQYPLELKGDVHCCLWAWTNFGGIGARTRRGCGALFCKEFAPPSGNFQSLREWFFSYYDTFAKGKVLSEIPSLQGGPLLLKQESEVISAWDSAIALLESFRQEGVGRKSRPLLQNRLSASNLPGRSYWPEPETIRRLQETRMQKHQPLKEHPDAFPRAELGLPIIFHFKDDKNDDPAECELYPHKPYETSRMSSPLILKPLAIVDGLKAVPMVLRLATTVLTGVRLKKVAGNPVFGEQAIRGSHLADYEKSPLKSRSSTGSTLEAFIEYAREKAFQEVDR